MARSAERAQFLADILTTAVEGGINHWATVLEYDVAEYLATGDPGKVRVKLTESEEVDEDGDGMAYRVTIDTIATGVNKIANAAAEEIKYLPERHRLLVAAASRENDFCPADGRYSDIDAGVADTILQVAIFGRVFYG